MALKDPRGTMMNGKKGTSVRTAERGDAERIAEIYNHYICRSAITFEEEPVTTSEILRRMQEIQSVSLPWLIAEGSETAGYAYASPWKHRSAYRFTVEITVYVAPGYAGRGVGSLLYDRLLPMLQAQQIHAVLGGIALPNEASVALHEKFGFRKVARFQQVGFKFNQWIDVEYWQRTL